MTGHLEICVDGRVGKQFGAVVRNLEGSISRCTYRKGGNVQGSWEHSV